MIKLNTTGLDIRVAAFRLVLTLFCLGIAAGSGSAGAESRVGVTTAISGGTGTDTADLESAVAGLSVHADGASSRAAAFDAAGWVDTDLGSVERNVFELALHAAAVAVERGDVEDPPTLTVIDFSQASPNERLWVYDLRSRTLLFQEVVSHGRGSGVALATAFSNAPESHQSSLGLYRTAETYVGKHGYSLRLDGLEEGFNDNARPRAIVMHAADYVNPAAAQANGYLGRSLGCPAVRPAISRRLIDTVKNGGLLFAYYPDASWLESSVYLP